LIGALSFAASPLTLLQAAARLHLSPTWTFFGRTRPSFSSRRRRGGGSLGCVSQTAIHALACYSSPSGSVHAVWRTAPACLSFAGVTLSRSSSPGAFIIPAGLCPHCLFLCMPAKGRRPVAAILAAHRSLRWYWMDVWAERTGGQPPIDSADGLERAARTLQAKHWYLSCSCCLQASSVLCCFTRKLYSPPYCFGVICGAGDAAVATRADGAGIAFAPSHNVII